MKNISVLIAVISLTTGPVFSDSAYRLGAKAELATGALGAALAVTSLLFHEAENPENPGEVNFLDRSFMYPRNETLDSLGTLTVSGLLVLPILTPLIMREDDLGVWGTYAVMYGEAFLLTTGIKEALKHRAARLRPYTFLSDPGTWDEEEYDESFPSGHTAYAFMGAAFLSTTFSREFPRSPWKGPVAAGAFSLAALTGLLRVGAGEHFVSDVLAGAALGTLCGWGIPFLHHLAGEDFPLSFSSAPVGLSFSLSY